MFRKCQRMYYYHYYGSWGGWDLKADIRTREIYILKQLQTRQMWAGTKVHESIEKVIKGIKSGERISLDIISETTRNIMRQDFLSSRSKKYFENPKTCALFEHEYTIQISNTEWKNTADSVDDCIKVFFSSDVYKKILDLNSDPWL